MAPTPNQKTAPHGDFSCTEKNFERKDKCVNGLDVLIGNVYILPLTLQV